MGREIRRVPADWQHPIEFRSTYIRGGVQSYGPVYKPLFGASVSKRIAEWEEEKAQWERDLRRSYGDEKWVPLESRHDGISFEEWDGPRPDPADYMPEWPDEQRTHLQMYETTSEGTPISPVLATAEELARWLADNEASAFGSKTATYEDWLAVAKGGWAPSAVILNGELMSGVAAMAKEK